MPLGAHMSTCGGQREKLCVFLCQFQVYVFSQGFLVNLNLAILVRAADQASSWDPIVSPSKHWNYRHTQPWSSFYVGPGDLNSGTVAFSVSTLTHWASSLALVCVLENWNHCYSEILVESYCSFLSSFFVVSGVFLILICPLKFVLSFCIMDVYLSHQYVDYSSITTTKSRIPLVYVYQGKFFFLLQFWRIVYW